MLPVKKSNFLAATLKREKTAKQRKEESEKDGKAIRSGKTSGKKEIESERGWRDGGSRGWR